MHFVATATGWQARMIFYGSNRNKRRRERGEQDTDKSGQVNVHILSYLFYAVSVYSRSLSTGFNHKPDASVGGMTMVIGLPKGVTVNNGRNVRIR